MPKAEKGTAKWLANKMKAKGLQKLRWYCQMCEKQCRDENGFKCHIGSESHQRQLLVVADDPDMFLDEFSQDFEKAYMDLLRRRFGTKRVHANIVYQEYISFKEHLHMNSTKWETLTEFVKYLGRTGKCIVDQTEKGWFVAYIDRDPETLLRQEELAKKQKMDKDDEERMAAFIEQQAERAKANSTMSYDEPTFTELQRASEDDKVEFGFKKIPSSSSCDNTKTKEGSAASSSNPLKKLSHARSDDSPSTSHQGSPTPSARDTSSDSKKRHLGSGSTAKRPSALDEIRQAEEDRREKLNRKDFWLCEGIVVKVISKKLTNHYNQKGVVECVEDKYVGVIRMIKDGKRIRIDQEDLETVIPAIGRNVMIVNGAYRGSRATLQKVHEHDFAVTVQINGGPLNGRVVEKVAYEDISKLSE